MISNVSLYISKWLLQKSVIRDEDIEIYEFGIYQLITNVIDFLSILIISMLFHEVLPCIVFLASFTWLRRCAGGYHAKSAIQCYTLTITTVVIVLSAIKLLTLSNFIYIGLWIWASVTIILLAPVDTENKPLDEIECIVYRRRALCVWGIESFLVLVCLLGLHITILASGIIWGQIIVAIAVMVEKSESKKKNV